jgi:hypothetical protein
MAQKMMNRVEVKAERLKRDERRLRECIAAFRASDRLSREESHDLARLIGRHDHG